jgi:hypothetical protein
MVAVTSEVKDILRAHVQNMPELSAKEKKEMLEQIDKGEGTIMNLMGIQPAFYEFAYSQALQSYDKRDLKKAYSLFHFLHLLKVDDPRAMMGIAATAQLKEDFEDAKYWYMMADHFMDHDPMITCYLSECFSKTNQPVQQKFFLEIAQERCLKDKKYETLKERIGLMLKGMENI